MEHKFIFNKDELEWQCVCGRPVDDMGLRATWHYSLEIHDNSLGQFGVNDWEITSSLHCECGKKFVSPDDYELDLGDDGSVGMILNATT